MTNAVDKARERLAGAMFATWDERDVKELVGSCASSPTP